MWQTGDQLPIKRYLLKCMKINQLDKVTQGCIKILIILGRAVWGFVLTSKNAVFIEGSRGVAAQS